ncbi:relaxin receptor 1-like [Xenia sp. Carnegie-2017]|uniref:relaxin receptor 1-like n=1 Tax=Xenia sp. Carnegie-2017 TaxID=2897299 RepID=UPI001F04EE49|nr:relaxin receptor 1-like [Xenia sp. Carnegie-2017]
MQLNAFSEFKHDNIFDPLVNLNYLDISGMESLNQINRLWFRLMRNLVNLKHLKTNVFTDCCFVNAYKPDVDCIAPSDTIASCERMIKYAALRYLMWFLVVLTIGGNVFALLLRLVKDDCSRVQNLFICSLSFSDMLMGVYLIGIINQEIATEGEYYKHDYPWRTGTPCKVFGIISVISSEVSVFTLVYIAYDRFLHIAHAMEFRKIGYRSALFLLLATWLVCSAIAIVPATVKTYFVDDVRRVGFYGTNSICMPLQLPGDDTIAWEYCLTIFGILNFIGAAYLIIAYIQMFYSSYSSAKDANNSSRLGAHTTMAKRFAAVVFTDVCCWVPIAMLLFLSLARAINDTGNTLYLWFSICVIPINSAINPILYTLSTPMFWQKVKDVIKKFIFSVSKSRMSGIDDEHVYDRAKKS